MTKRLQLPKPSDIDVTQHFFDSFDRTELEVSARYIVRYMQKVEAESGAIWPSFTYKQIDEFYTKHGAGDGFTFNGLVRTRGYGDSTVFKSTPNITVDEHGEMTVTLEFVSRCFASSPKNN